MKQYFNDRRLNYKLDQLLTIYSTNQVGRVKILVDGKRTSLTGHVINKIREVIYRVAITTWVEITSENLSTLENTCL